MPSNHNEIEKKLWDAADELRANSKLKSSEYSVPVLALISLRYADHKFSQLENDRLKRALDAGSLIDSGTIKDDAQFRIVFDAIRQLMVPPKGKGRPIGFVVKERVARYGLRRF